MAGKKDPTFFPPGTRLLRIPRWSLILALRLLSASLWFFSAAALLSAGTPLLSSFNGASTSSSLSLSSTNEEVETDPFLIDAELAQNPS